MRAFLAVFVVNPRRLIAALAAIMVVLIALSVAGQIIRYVFHHRSAFGFVAFFDVDAENNVPTFFSGILLLSCSALLTGISRLHDVQRIPYSRHWLGLAVCFLYLAFDEVAAVHERWIAPLRVRFNTQGVFHFAWVIVAIPIVLLLAIVYLRFLLRLPKRTRNLFVVAGSLYVGGAIGMELAGSWYVTQFGGDNLTYNLLTTVEETCELTGVIVFLYTLFDYLSVTFPRYRVMVERESS